MSRTTDNGLKRAEKARSNRLNLSDFWCLTPFSAIFQQPFRSILFLLYLVGQFDCLEKPEYSEKTIVLSQFTKEIYHIKLYRVHLAMSGIQAHRVSGDMH
jgi:hypothetical protein